MLRQVAIVLVPFRPGWRRLVLIAAAQPLVAGIVAAISPLQTFPGIVWVADGLVCAYLAGLLVALAAAAEVIALVLVLHALPGKTPASGVAAGIVLIAIASAIVSEAFRRERLARRQTDEANARNRSLLELAFDATVLSVDGVIAEANAGFERLLGLEPGAAVGRSLLDFVAPDSREAVEARLAAGGSGPLEYTGLTAAGEERALRGVGINVVYRGRPARLGGITDVTSQRRAEAELHESAAVLARAHELAKLGSFVIDMATRTSHCSRETALILGRDGAFSMSLDELRERFVPEDCREEWIAQHDAAYRAGGPFSFTQRMQTTSGEQIWVRIHGLAELDEQRSPLRAVAVVQDVTEQLRLEQQARQTKKMEAIGQLAGGIAHDFNNLLTVIGGNVLLLGFEELAPSAREHVDEINAASERASALTRQLLTFARKREPSLELIDLNDAIISVEVLLRRLLGPTIRIESDFAMDLRAVRADRAQLEQALINLALNARDAMPDGGHLRMATQSAPQAAILQVSDTGVGMDDETRDRIFEPFFTTKPTGEGTGLGLANVYAIVADAGGDIEVASEPGAGTTFTITFPAAEGAQWAGDVSRAPEQVMARAGRVLFVDDEEAVRKVARTALARAGHEPLLAAGGPEALRILTDGEPIDLLVTDLSMPEMSGVELAQRARELRPDLPVLYVSGYSDKHAAPEADVLEKPFTPRELNARVAAALSVSASAEAR
ncbi:MAG TPA: ATP-binding protein [Gaiellaceae bacterium]|nr:ATP-binding protein [Gaiellaceae bacterium]